MNDYVNLTLDNLDTEHLCCAIADKKHREGVQFKKDWLRARIPEGHIFRKLNAQGKVFIEYSPLETAWTPIEGKNFIYIYCLWVAGSFQGHGYARELLNYCLDDARKQGKSGVCVITSVKKKPFTQDKKFFGKFGFKLSDKIDDYELLTLSFNGETARFTDAARKMEITDTAFTVYYSPECPYTNNCAVEIAEYAKENSVQINIIRVDTLEKAKAMPCVFNNWANFSGGKYISNCLLNKNSLDKLIR